MQCPTCQTPLRTMDYEGIRIDSCGDCGGTWLDAGELKHVVRAREVRFDPDERRAIASAAKITGIKMSEVDRAYTCPKCKEQTSAIHYGGDSGIIIDRCPACRGIWLDQGELEKIQQIVEGWEDCLPDDLAKHGAKLRQIAVDMEYRRQRQCIPFRLRQRHDKRHPGRPHIARPLESVGNRSDFSPISLTTSLALRR